MPYPNEHAARVIEPSKFEKDSFKRKEITDGVTVILGKLIGEDTMTIQTYRFDKNKFTVAEAKKWLDDNDLKTIKFEPAGINASEEFKETYEVRGKEIFAIGKYNGIEITQQILNNMVSAFQELKNRRQVPLKLGHSRNQKMLQADGMPAAGWITNLYTQGKKLICDITGIPEKIKEYIENKNYRNVSIEMMRGWVDGGTKKKYPNILTAVALLGADIPAVPGLNEFERLFELEGEDIVVFNSADLIKQEEKVMDEKLQKELELKDAEIKKFSDDKIKFTEELKAKEEELKAKEEELKAIKEKSREDDIEAFIDANSVEGNFKIAPKNKELVKNIFLSFSDDVVKFNEKEISVANAFKEFISGLPEVVDFSDKLDKNFNEKISENNTNKFEDEIIDEKIRKIMEADKINYSEAYEKVINEMKEAK